VSLRVVYDSDLIKDIVVWKEGLQKWQRKEGMVVAKVEWKGSVVRWLSPLSFVKFVECLTQLNHSKNRVNVCKKSLNHDF
jgi:hypothetical protein